MFVAFRSEEQRWQNYTDELRSSRAACCRHRQELSEERRHEVDSALANAIQELVAEFKLHCRSIEDAFSTATYSDPTYLEIAKISRIIDTALLRVQDGARTDIFDDTRSYNIHGDAQDDSCNLAHLFQLSVTFLESIAHRDNKLVDEFSNVLVALFQALIQAEGNGVRDNALGFPHHSYHTFEEIIGNITAVCRRNIFREGYLYRVTHNAANVRQVDLHAHESLCFAFSVFELQTIVEGFAEVRALPLKSTDRRSIRSFPAVAYIDLFCFRQTSTASDLPPVLQYLHERAIRLMVFVGFDHEQITDDIRNLASWNAPQMRHERGISQPCAGVDWPLFLTVVESSLCAKHTQESDTEEFLIRLMSEDLRPLLMANTFFSDKPRRHVFLDMWKRLTPLQQRVLLRSCPAFPFDLVRRRERTMLEAMLRSDQSVLDTLACLRHPETAADLLTWTCGQRGLTHCIVELMLSSKAFDACGCPEQCRAHSNCSVVVARQSAVDAAMSVRNMKVVSLLQSEWNGSRT
eukprot:TRINITY_DN58940_c0_g1_i1.p1 TRINITY_DN58940_c0_g1~~TRINITY_DN58940_c0_g1_i1.p1  ORF type:complete len:520 (+),score=27.18 TRINITY_DN58940_c0_g1_i1:315-1874(+)